MSDGSVMRISLYWVENGKRWRATATYHGVVVASRTWQTESRGAPCIKDAEMLLKALETESQGWLW